MYNLDPNRNLLPTLPAFKKEKEKKESLAFLRAACPQIPY
jgi:hypothetical protein